eukprot:3121343-Amphidinium_carterae.2
MPPVCAISPMHSASGMDKVVRHFLQRSVLVGFGAAFLGASRLMSRETSSDETDTPGASTVPWFTGRLWLMYELCVAGAALKC